MGADSFLDETILKMIDQAEAQETISDAPPGTKEDISPDERTIYTGIKIRGQWIEFEGRPFIDAKITMTVPKDFTDMEPEIARIKYPMEKRPKTILTDSTGSTNITFTYIDTPMGDESLVTIRDGLFAMMHRANPGIKMQSKGEDVIDRKDVAYIEFTNTAMDAKVYNLMFFLVLEGRPLMGNFNCISTSMKYWQKPAFEMMRSIQIIIPEGVRGV